MYSTRIEPNTRSRLNATFAGRLAVGWLTSLLLLALVGCATLDNAEPPAALTEIAEPEPLHKSWWIDSGEGVRENHVKLRPLLLGDRIFTIDSVGEIKLIDAATGDEVWAQQTGLRAIGSLAGDEEVLVASSREGDVVLFQQLEDGLKEVWRVRLSSEIRAPALLDGDLVLVRGGDGKLHALNRSNGGSAWAIVRSVPALSLTGTSRPLVYRDLVIAGFDNGKLVAFDRASGSTEWETTVGSPRGRSEIERLVDVDSQFVIRDGVIYVSSFQGNLAAITANSGQVLWSRKFSSSHALAIDNEAIYLTDDRSHLWSIDRRTGSAFWKQDVLTARKITAPTLVDDHLVVGDFDGFVHWFRKNDGQLVGRIKVMDLRMLAQPVTWQDSVLFIDAGGELASITRKTER